MNVMNRLAKICVFLPETEDMQFIRDFLALLSSIATSTTVSGTPCFIPTYPQDSGPMTCFYPSPHPTVTIHFQDADNTDIMPEKNLLTTVFTNAHGSDEQPMPTPPLELPQLREIFNNKLLRLDHFGVNIPSSSVERAEYVQFLNELGTWCNLHHYPTGQDWDFMLPSSHTEWVDGISEFQPGRDPKWEFVYDDYTEIPVLQLCIETKYTKKRLCQVLPEPHGISYPGLPFRIVFLQTPWNNMRIRCDFKARSTNPKNSWNTGEWLATRGQRIGPSIEERG